MKLKLYPSKNSEYVNMGFESAELGWIVELELEQQQIFHF
jgi:hypothetical protein